ISAVATPQTSCLDSSILAIWAKRFMDFMFAPKEKAANGLPWVVVSSVFNLCYSIQSHQGAPPPQQANFGLAGDPGLGHTSFVGLNFYRRSGALRGAFDLKRKDSSGRDYGVAHADGMFTQAFANFVDGEHTGADIEVIDLGLLECVEGAVLLPDKFDVAEAEVSIHD